MGLTVTSNEVAKDSWLVSLVPLKSLTGDLKVANPSSVSMFMFGGSGGLWFSSPWFSFGRFPLSLGSIFIIISAILYDSLISALMTKVSQTTFSFYPNKIINISLCKTKEKYVICLQ
jgi:hypothetical protein